MGILPPGCTWADSAALIEPLSADVAKSTEQEAQYIRNKGFDDQYYKDMIVECIKTFQRVKRKKIKELLWEKLPDVLTDKQKEAKITTLLTSLRKKGIIQTDSPNQQTSCWILVENDTSNKNEWSRNSCSKAIIELYLVGNLV